ncbi:hypothetical protein Taro_054895, partial [Colocasia esculenta]|nr:hypothetical protein [Colocasia esculenta]
VRYNGVQRDCHENREKHFSIQLDGQQIHVEERRPSSLIAERNVQGNSSYTAPHNGSIYCDMLAAFPDLNSAGYALRLLLQNTVQTLVGLRGLGKRRTIQHPLTLGTTVNRVDVEPTPQDPSGTTNCPRESNFDM